MPRGAYLVDDFGAVAQAFNDATAVTADRRTANVTAINAALAEVMAAGGGTLYFGPGVYYTNAAVGFDLAADTNVAITIQGTNPFPGSMISSNSSTQENFKIYTTTGNIRNLYMKDMTFLGGRTGLSLIRCDYYRFERIWFWGADQFCLQMYQCYFDLFTDCYFTESGSFGDAIFTLLCEAEFVSTTFGETGGGVVVWESTIKLVGGTFTQNCFYRSKGYTDYWTNPGSPANGSLASIAGEEAAIIAISGSLILNGVQFGAAHKSVMLDYATRALINGCLFSSDSANFVFEGFIHVRNNAQGLLALNIAGCQFIWNGADSGYFIKEPQALLHDAMISAQLDVKATATMTALSSSAPALLNPGSQNNLVTTRTFARA